MPMPAIELEFLNGMLWNQTLNYHNKVEELRNESSSDLSMPKGIRLTRRRVGV